MYKQDAVELHYFISYIDISIFLNKNILDLTEQEWSKHNNRLKR